MIEVRCPCRSRPLLGIAKEIDGRWIFHVKVYKQKRLYAELEITSGLAKVRCRDCKRWHNITVGHNFDKSSAIGVASRQSQAVPSECHA